MKKNLFVFLLSIGMIFLNINFISAETTDKIYWAVDGVCEDNGEDAISASKPCVLTLSNNIITGSKASGNFEIDEVFEETAPWGEYLFNLTDIVIGGEDDIIKPTSTAYWFGPQLYFVETIDFTYLDTSDVTNMESMFNNANGLVSLDLSGFNTLNVTDYAYMFFDMNPTVQIKVGSNWNLNLSDEHTWKAISNGSLYPEGKIVKNKIETYTPALIYWGVDGVCDEAGDEALEHGNPCTLKISNEYFDASKNSGFINVDAEFRNEEQNPWQQYLFNITNIVIGGENDIIKPLSTAYWFGPQLYFVETIDFTYLDTSDVTNMSHMFENANGLVSLDLSNFDTSKVKNNAYMFSDTSPIVKVGSKWNINLSEDYVWMNTSNGEAYNYGDIPTKQSATYIPLKFFWAVDGENCKTDSGNCTLTISNNWIDGEHFDDSLLVPEDTYEFSYNSNFGNSWEDYSSGITKVVVGTGVDDVIMPTTTAYWFSNFTNLKTIDLRYLDTKYVLNMAHMFERCNSLETINLSNFDTSNTTNFSDMFRGCTSLKSLDLSNFDTSNIGADNFDYMFYNCTSLESLNLSSFDTSNVVKEDTYILGAFSNCESLTNLIIGKKWNATIDNNLIFKNNETGEIYTTKFKENTEGSYSALTSKYYWAVDGDDCEDYTSSCTLRISNNTITGTHFDNGYSSEFELPDDIAYYTNSITNVIIGGQGDIIKPYSTASWFASMPNLESIDLTYLDTSEVRDMRYMFAYCNSLKELDLSKFNTSNVNIMYSMFEGCNSLKELNLSNLNTSNVIDMHNMFSDCESLEKLDLSSFNTSNATDMYGMFENCYSLESLNISKFNTSNVFDMAYMFMNCYSLKFIDLSSFDTSNVKYLSWMFKNCYALTSLDLSSFNTSNVTDMSSMFENVKLPRLDISNFDMSKLDYNSVFDNINSETVLAFKSGMKTDILPHTIYNSKDTPVTGNMATGYYLINNNETKIYISVNGDVNGDSKITISDVMKTSDYVINGSEGISNNFRQSADVNGDGKLSISDVMKISNYVINGGNL